jgi:Family of unknown function (DUF6055)
MNIKNSRCIKSFIIVFLLYVSPLFAEMTAQQQELQNRVKTNLGIDTSEARPLYGFTYQIALTEIYDQLSPNLQKIAATIISPDRPKRSLMVQSPSGKFNLFYESDPDSFHAVPATDISGNGIPDFIDSAAVFLDYCWQQEIEVMGYQPPLDSLGNPVDHYDVYFSNMSYYGFITFEHEIPALPGDNYTSYMELNNTFQRNFFTKGLDGMQATCAHEFHHAIQIGYNFRSDDTYIFEMTSTWMEDVIYPGINDYYQYLNNLFLNAQSAGFTDFAQRYGNGIYFKLLAAQHSQAVVREIWEQIKNEKAIDAIKTILNKKGSSFSQSLNDYGKWMYFTGERAIPDLFFDDAADFPMVTIPNSAKFSGESIVKLETAIAPQSFYYIAVDSILNNSGVASVEVKTNNPNIRLNYFNSAQNAVQSVGSGLNQPIILEQVPQDFTFLISNSRDTTVSATFIFKSDSTFQLPTGPEVAFGPNPAKISDGVSYFYKIPAESKIVIMDLNLHPVRTFYNKNAEDILQLKWDLRDDHGKPLSSGVYYFVVVSLQKEQVGKIAIIR